MVALICVLKYVTSLDRTVLLNGDPLCLRIQGMKKLYTSGDASLDMLRDVEKVRGGEVGLDISMQWIASQHGVSMNAENPSLQWRSVNIIQKYGGTFEKFVSSVMEKDSKVNTSIRFRDHTSFPSDLESWSHARAPSHSD